MLQRKFDLTVPGTYSSHIPSRSTPAPKNSSSALAVSNPDMDRQSNPSTRAVTMKYAPCSVAVALATTYFQVLGPALSVVKFLKVLDREECEDGSTA